MLNAFSILKTTIFWHFLMCELEKPSCCTCCWTSCHQWKQQGYGFNQSCSHSAWVMTVTGVTVVLHAKPSLGVSGDGAVSHVATRGGGGVSPYAAICRVILLFFHDSVKARLVILTSLWCWTVLVESLWTDKRAGSGSVSLIIWPFSISLGTCCCFKPDRAISRKGLWLVPDVWTAVGSQGNTAIYPEDIKWPNDHIIWRTNLSKSCLQAGEMSSNPFVQIMSSPMEKKNSYF